MSDAAAGEPTGSVPPVPPAGTGAGTGAGARPQPPLLNVANVLTGLRIVLVPLFAVALLADEGRSILLRLLATALFALASLTDLYDGRLARSRNLVTRFGEVADPIADKALIGAALVGLSVLGTLWWWVTILILVRELGITALRFGVMRHGVIPSSRGGKLKTLLQVIAILWCLMPFPSPFSALGVPLMAAALVATVVTGLDYVAQALALRRGARR
jgi:CDP-diacylglycerol--glycerol-3-phosphate 3-phosphatidyltransferase